ncbi:MAG: hypothetical protein WAZ40_02930 [Minisyncoccia bacterium]
MPAQQFRFPIVLVFFLVAIAVVNGFAGYYHWYWIYRWFDMPMHFLGGAWLAGFGIWWQYAKKGIAVPKFSTLLPVCLVYVLSIGLLWEVYEAVIGFMTVGHANAINDTISDLFFDIGGGIVVAFGVKMSLR